MCFLQESATWLNGLHESNSKLNIRSYPKARKTDSDLILLLCPRALCCSIKHLWDSPVHKPAGSYSTTKVTYLRASFACFLLRTIFYYWLWAGLPFKINNSAQLFSQKLDLCAKTQIFRDQIEQPVNIRKKKDEIPSSGSSAVDNMVHICHSEPVARPRLLGRKVTGS